MRRLRPAVIALLLAVAVTAAAEPLTLVRAYELAASGSLELQGVAPAAGRFIRGALARR